MFFGQSGCVSPRLPPFDYSTDKIIVHRAGIPVAAVPHSERRVAPSFPRSLRKGWKANAADAANSATHFQLQFGIELSPLNVS
jgi:hypothetical protein